MMECMVSFTMAENLYGHAFVPPREPIAYTRSINPNRKPYKTKDGYIAIMPYSNENWLNFLAHGGREGLMEDPRFSTYKERTKNISDLYKVCEDVALLKTTDEWMEILASENVPCMRVHSLKSVLEDPQISETGFLEKREHPTEGTYTAINNPISFSESPVTIDREPPLLGQHNREIAAEIGLSDDMIDAFIKDGVFGTTDAD